MISTKNEQIQFIPLHSIFPHPDNRRVGGFDKKKLEQLADSIKAVGVQEPAVVRCRTKGDYELVVGERRWRACKLAGIDTLPCIIRDIEDISLMKILTIENLQREDVHPLDEAEGYRRLMELGNMTADQIAEEIGQTRSYVYHRLKLCVLGKKPRQALIKKKISTAHAELIARLPGHYQDKALELCFERTWIEGTSTHITLPLKTVRKRIAQVLFCDLNASAFKKDDAELVPEAGLCTTCPKRTGNAPELFPELEGKDSCTDTRCYDTKRKSYVKQKREELKNKGEEFVEVQGDQGWHDPDGEHAVNSWNWQECKKKDPDAERVLVVSGIDKGRMTWGKVEADEPGGEDSLKWELDSKKREIETKCNQAVRRRILDDIRTWYKTNKDTWIPDTTELSVIARQFFERLWYESQNRILKLQGWKREDISDGDIYKRLSQLKEKDLLIFIIDCSLVDVTGMYANDEATDMLQTVAKLHDVDVDTIESDIKKEYDEKWKKIEARMRKEREKESAV
jgi:ParB/RepB/Spo0J family partition protein